MVLAIQHFQKRVQTPWRGPQVWAAYESTTIRMSILSKHSYDYEQDFCPSRFGRFEAPDLSGKPNNRPRKFWKEELEEKVGDTRLLLPCAIEKKIHPYYLLTLSSIELIEARDIHAGLS